MSLLVTLPLQLACQLISPSVNQSIAMDLPSGYTVFYEVGFAYKYYDNNLPWNEARKQCIADGASLFVADSRQKINLIMAWTGVLNKGIHNGIHRCFDNAEWTGVKDGKPQKFVPWKPDPFLNDQARCCSAHFNDGSGVGAWKCLDKLTFVCEIPLVRESKPAANLKKALLAN